MDRFRLLFREWVGCYLASEIIALSIMLGLVYRQWRRKRVDIGARPPRQRWIIFKLVTALL